MPVENLLRPFFKKSGVDVQIWREQKGTVLVEMVKLCCAIDLVLVKLDLWDLIDILFAVRATS